MLSNFARETTDGMGVGQLLTGQLITGQLFTRTLAHQANEKVDTCSPVNF